MAFSATFNAPVYYQSLIDERLLTIELMEKEIIDLTAVIESISNDEQTAFLHACDTIKIYKDNILISERDIKSLKRDIERENNKHKYTDPDYVSPLLKTVADLEHTIINYTQQIELIRSRLPLDDPVTKRANSILRKNTCSKEIKKLLTDVAGLAQEYRESTEFYNERRDLMDSLREKYLEFATNHNILFDS